MKFKVGHIVYEGISDEWKKFSDEEMKFKVGDIVYESSGNGLFYTFVKCIIIEIAGTGFNQYYRIKILEDYGSVWSGEKRNKTAMPGTIDICLKNLVFTTYEEAKINLYKEMHFESDREFIANYLNQ